MDAILIIFFYSYGMVWYGMVWYGMVSYRIVSYRTVRYGIVSYRIASVSGLQFRYVVLSRLKGRQKRNNKEQKSNGTKRKIIYLSLFRFVAHVQVIV